MTTETLTTLLDNFLDQPKVTSFELMTQGKENTTILANTPGGAVIVRLWGKTHGYMGAYSLGDIVDEVSFMEFCRHRGMPVPKLYRSKSGELYDKAPDGRHYVVMEYANGAAPQSFTKTMTTQIAETMACMHLLVADFAFPRTRSWPGSVLDMTNDRISLFEAGKFTLNKQDHALLTEMISQYKTALWRCNLLALPRGIIHGDIMWENMKFNGEQLQSIFDFGDCRESFFVEDIAKSLFFAFESPEHSIFGENGENVRSFLRAYQTKRKLTTDELQGLPLFFLSRILYQFLGYHTKITKGQPGYQAKADHAIARYRQHKQFFSQDFTSNA